MRIAPIFLILAACGGPSAGGPGSSETGGGTSAGTGTAELSTSEAPACTEAVDSTGPVMYDDAAIFVLETAGAGLCANGDEQYQAMAWEVCAVETDPCPPTNYDYIGDSFSCLDGTPASSTVVVHQSGDFAVGWHVLRPIPSGEGTAYLEEWVCFSEKSLDHAFTVTEDDYNDETTFVLTSPSASDRRSCEAQCLGSSQFGAEGCHPA